MRFNILFKGLVLFLMLSSQAFAQNARYASEQRANAATTYYSRARTMLVEALAEYEQGRRYAQPNMIHDPEEFRLALISLTEELNRLVDPHVKITRDGVRVKANPRMIRRERDRLPEVVDPAQEASDVGEKRRMKEIKEARARMYAPKEETKVEEIDETPVEEPKEELTEADRKESVDKIIEDAVEEKATEEKSEEISSDSEAEAPVETVKEEAKPTEEATSGKVVEDKEAKEASDTSKPEEKTEAAQQDESPAEDAAVASAIESTIQERLKNLEVGLDEESAE